MDPEHPEDKNSTQRLAQLSICPLFIVKHIKEFVFTGRLSDLPNIIVFFGQKNKNH